MNRIQRFIISAPDVHTPAVNFSTFQNGCFIFVSKFCNRFPTSIQNTSHDIRQFKSYLKLPYKFILLRGIFYLEFK